MRVQRTFPESASFGCLALFDCEEFDNWERNQIFAIRPAFYWLGQERCYYQEMVIIPEYQM